MDVSDRIGTPLSDTATTVMLLGAGELGKEIAIAFQRLGVEVHAVDRYVNAPAQHVAHGFTLLDLTDGHALYQLVREIRPDYVVPECEVVNATALNRIKKEGLATVVPSAYAVATTTSRDAIRTLAATTLGIPTPTYGFANTPDEVHAAARHVGFPCIVKPNVGTAARGQTIVSGVDELDEAWRTASAEAHRASGGASAHVIVEEYIDFDYEVTMLTIRSVDGDDCHDAMWFCEPIGHTTLGECDDFLESWQPAPMSGVALDAARSIAARITTALGGRGVFGIELFVSGDDVYFSEVSPRPHDTGLVTIATQRFSEFELHVRAILGLPIDATCVSPGAAAVITAHTTAPGMVYTGLRAALSEPEVDVRLFGKPTAYPGRRLGVALATADTVHVARGRAIRAAEAMTVEYVR